MADALRFYSHRIDPATFYCTGCGQFLAVLQRKTVWRDNVPEPVCADVTAISHLVRQREVAA
jgi:hypothetical protein